MKELTMEERVIDALGGRKGLTVNECTRFIGTTELRKRVSDLKQKGYKIVDRWETGLNRHGFPTRFKRYFLIGKVRSI